MTKNATAISDITKHERTITLAEPVQMRNSHGAPFMATIIRINWDNEPNGHATEENPHIIAMGKAILANGNIGKSTRHQWFTLGAPDRWAVACPEWLAKLVHG